MPNEQDALDAYRRFVADAAVSGEVWVLQDEEGPAWCESNEYESDQEGEEVGVVLVWSDEEAARRAAADEWAEYRASAIPVEVFLDHWLPKLEQEGDLVGPNYDSELIGAEVEPQEMTERLKAAIERVHGSNGSL